MTLKANFDRSMIANNIIRLCDVQLNKIASFLPSKIVLRIFSGHLFLLNLLIINDYLWSDPKKGLIRTKKGPRKKIRFDKTVYL